jgi:hypothetical protein
MPCNHKFQNKLNLEQIDYAPTTLIVGTFMPEWPVGNPADWFYGRTENKYFWDILPRLYGEQSLMNATQAEWKKFCCEKQIAITDLISSIDDAQPDNLEHVKILAGGSDKAIAYNFDDFNFVNIVQILQRQSTIRNVYLTRGITEAFWKHLWNPVMQYCSHNHLHERKLLTPSGEASYQHGAYNEEHPENKIPLLEEYLLMKWQEEWHF